jgi:hypothetical protein
MQQPKHVTSDAKKKKKKVKNGLRFKDFFFNAKVNSLVAPRDNCISILVFDPSFNFCKPRQCLHIIK